MKPNLRDVELLAWIGEDERGSEIIGIKQGLVPAGLIPLVAIGEHADRMTRDYLVEGMQAQTDTWGKRIFLARFKFVEVVLATETSPDTEQVEIPQR